MSIASHRMTRQLSQSVALTPRRAVWLLLAICVVAFWPTFVSLARIWRDMFDYHHGVVIAAISIIWLWRVRRDLDTCSVRPVRAALPLLALALLAWMIAYRANSELMQQLLLPVIPLLAVYAAGGLQLCRRVAAPIAYLYFAIPLWELLLPYLQWLTTTVAESLLGLIGVPTQVEGHYVTIPSGRFSIIEGCSGKRYVVIALAFAYLAAAVEGLRWRRTAVVMTSAVVLALITNWVRVVTVIYAGHVTQMQHYLVAEEHHSFGYALFIPLLLAILWIARRSRQRQPIGPVSPAAPEVERRGRPIDWAIVMGLAALPILVWARTAEHAYVAHLAAMPVATGAWQGPLPGVAAWQPRFLGASEERRAAYQQDGQRFEIYMNVYGAQSQGRELVFHHNSFAPADRFAQIRRLSRSAGTSPAEVIAETNGGSRWVVMHTYRVGGWQTDSPGLAQLYYGLHAIVRPVPAGTLAVAVRCAEDCSSAEQVIQRFWREHARELVGLIPDR
jgi:exosortase A